MLCSATESVVRVPRRPHVHRAVGAPPQHRDLGKPAPSGPVAAHVCQHLTQLSVVNYTMWAHNAC